MVATAGQHLSMLTGNTQVSSVDELVLDPPFAIPEIKGISKDSRSALVSVIGIYGHCGYRYDGTGVVPRTGGAGLCAVISAP